MTHSKKIKPALIVLLTKVFLRGLAFLSLKNCHRLGALLGWLISVTPNRHHFVTTTNVKLCFPEMDSAQQQQLVKQSLIETGKTATEISPMWQWSKEKLFNSIKSIKGEELLQQALKENKGVILAAPHLGNWELLGQYLADKYPTTCMYQKPKIKELDSIIRNGRQRFGVKLVPTDNQGIRAMLKSLKNNELVCILPDQEPSEGNGVFAPFFGIQAYSMILISRFAKKTGATVLTIYGKRLTNGEGYEIVFSPLDKISEGSLEESVTYLNSEMEKCIRDIPEQYQWSYKRFRRQPEIKDERITGKDFYNP
ncbi:MAG: lysophospholipid acyltransferase family protein [Gammaproteobacteria bacterium]|nr:lysophospholipid acyltransferase family protein [Gammaproteobacteria bacterium]